jgi:Mg-chelatase subunit ChlD
MPADVCCIVDVSGSMKTKAQYEDASGNMVDDGMTMLDITKHAVKAVMHILQEDGRLTIVTFSSNANVVFPSTKMCETGRATGLDILASLQPGGTTNIWSGMLAGLEALRACADEGPRQQFLLLLTDGQPDSDDKDHWRKLGDYRDQYPDFGFQLSTFGFGYKVISQLLLDLACAGSGTYSFIPTR